MTIIAGFFQDGCPILFGDLLVSSKDNAEMELFFPTVGKISTSDLLNGELRPSGLCQKIILVSPKLVIAWSGTKFYAKCFIEDIVKANCHEHPTRDLLTNIYNYKDGYGDDTSFICMYKNGVEMGIFGLDSLPVYCQNEQFSYFSAAGTGYVKLSDIVSDMKIEAESGEPNKLERAIASSMVFSTSLLSQEIVNPLSLKQLFGVGYEVAHPLKSELAKFRDVTYNFWYAEESRLGSWDIFPTLFLSFKYSYIGDILIIRSIKLTQGSNDLTYNIERDGFRAIPPVHRKLNPEELLNYSPQTMNSKWMCNVFIWRNLKGKMGFKAGFSHYSTVSPPIVWMNEFKDGPHVSIDLTFLESSLRQIATHAADK